MIRQGADAMIAEKMMELGRQRSVIREIFEYGNQRRSEIGAENVFDFSLGNPSVPAPDCINKTIRELTETVDSVALHGYTSAPGDPQFRKAIAENINSRFGTEVTFDRIYVTCGAAAALTIALNALICPRKEGGAADEIIAFTPFFPEYRVFTEAAGGRLIVVPTRQDDFQLDMEAFAQVVTRRTKAVIINSPNNPSGVVYSPETISAFCSVLREKEKEFGHTIWLISDEPYRELVYDGLEVPYLMNHYDDTIVCYSFSKSMSLPGERIGYLAVSPRMAEADDVYAAICGAGRALGYVCAPSLMQKVISRCLGAVSDVEIYRQNRDLLYYSLSKLNFHCVRPDGAFYLFMKTPEDAWEFCEKAKRFELLLVPGDDFGCPGYVRIAYCVSTQMIMDSLPAFAALAKLYGLTSEDE